MSQDAAHVVSAWEASDRIFPQHVRIHPHRADSTEVLASLSSLLSRRESHPRLHAFLVLALLYIQSISHIVMWELRLRCARLREAKVETNEALEPAPDGNCLDLPEFWQALLPAQGRSGR